MDRHIDIHKAGAILIRDRKFLVTRARGKEFFVAPGGKIDHGETVKDALIRELKEELGIETHIPDLEEFGTFYAPAAGQEDRFLQMDISLVKQWHGEISPQSEIEELQWVGSLIPEGMRLGSIFEHEVLPRLKGMGLIE